MSTVVIWAGSITQSAFGRSLEQPRRVCVGGDGPQWPHIYLRCCQPNLPYLCGQLFCIALQEAMRQPGHNEASCTHAVPVPQQGDYPTANPHPRAIRRQLPTTISRSLHRAADSRCQGTRRSWVAHWNTKRTNTKG